MLGAWLADVFIVNLAWWQATGQQDPFLWSTAYHVFNAVIFLATMSLFAIAPDQARRYGRWALLIALAIEAAAVLFDTGIRNSGTLRTQTSSGTGRCWSAPCGSR